MQETITHSADETIAFGRKLASQLTPPKLVILSGDLGAGKTTLIKGIVEGFRSSLFGRPFNWTSLAVSALITVFSLIYASFSFSRVERRFADII